MLDAARGGNQAIISDVVGVLLVLRLIFDVVASSISKSPAPCPNILTSPSVPVVDDAAPRLAGQRLVKSGTCGVVVDWYELPTATLPLTSDGLNRVTIIPTVAVKRTSANKICNIFFILFIWGFLFGDLFFFS